MVLLALPCILLFSNGPQGQQTSQGKALWLPTGWRFCLQGQTQPRLQLLIRQQLRLLVMAALPISPARAWQPLCRGRIAHLVILGMSTQTTRCKQQLV